MHAMATKPNTSVELARYFDDNNVERKVTVANYHNLFSSSKDKNSIADFIYFRLFSRYLKPFTFDNTDFTKYFKNGFSIIANCCLLVETLESFKKGFGANP